MIYLDLTSFVMRTKKKQKNLAYKTYKADTVTYQIIRQWEGELGQRLHDFQFTLLLLFIGKPGTPHVLAEKKRKRMKKCMNYFRKCFSHAVHSAAPEMPNQCFQINQIFLTEQAYIVNRKSFRI